jgi:hypothetical protein
MLSSRLPPRVEHMAVKQDGYSTEAVRTDGGGVFTNSRWEEPLATWSVTSAPMKRSAADYIDTKALFNAALGSGDTFAFHDVEICDDVAVRFKDDTLRYIPEGNLVRLAFELEQDRNL